MVRSVRRRRLYGRGSDCIRRSSGERTKKERARERHFPYIQMQVKLAVEMPVTRRSDFKEAASVEDQLNELQLGQRLPPRNRVKKMRGSVQKCLFLKFFSGIAYDEFEEAFCDAQVSQVGFLIVCCIDSYFPPQAWAL